MEGCTLGRFRGEPQNRFLEHANEQYFAFLDLEKIGLPHSAWQCPRKRNVRMLHLYDIAVPYAWLNEIDPLEDRQAILQRILDRFSTSAKD